MAAGEPLRGEYFLFCVQYERNTLLRHHVANVFPVTLFFFKITITFFQRRRNRNHMKLSQLQCPPTASAPPLDDRDCHGSLARSGNFTGNQSNVFVWASQRRIQVWTSGGTSEETMGGGGYHTRPPIFFFFFFLFGGGGEKRGVGWNWCDWSVLNTKTMINVRVVFFL